MTPSLAAAVERLKSDTYYTAWSGARPQVSADIRLILAELERRGMIIDRYRKALSEIAAHAGMTNLGACCCDKTCHPYFNDEGAQLSSCSFQYGVCRGFNTCAHEAKDALVYDGERTENQGAG